IATRGDILENVEAFFRRFGHFKQREQPVCAEIGTLLGRFTAALQELRMDEQAWEAITAPHFNVFRVLNVQRKEVKLHSRFLAELLNPRGSHSQRHRFQKLFLEQADDCGLKWPEGPIEEFEWQVTTEEAIEVHGNPGQLDIVSRCPCGPVLGFCHRDTCFRFESEPNPEVTAAECYR